MPMTFTEMMTSRLAFLISVFTVFAFMSGAVAWAFATFQTVQHADQDGVVVMQLLHDIKVDQAMMRREIAELYKLMIERKSER